MTARCVWVIEVDGNPCAVRNDRYVGYEELVRWRASHGKAARLVRYSPGSKTERNRTKQHARAAATRKARGAVMALELRPVGTREACVEQRRRAGNPKARAA